MHEDEEYPKENSLMNSLHTKASGKMQLGSVGFHPTLFRMESWAMDCRLEGHKMGRSALLLVL
jgi:hypothetical protein